MSTPKKLDEDEFKTRLAENLRRARVDTLGSNSQSKLARMSGVSRITVRNAEDGTYTPSAYTLYQIADALGVNIDELMP